jgi:hypothetical protein
MGGGGGGNVTAFLPVHTQDESGPSHNLAYLLSSAPDLHMFFSAHFYEAGLETAFFLDLPKMTNVRVPLVVFLNLKKKLTENG